MKALAAIYRDGKLLHWYEPTPGKPANPENAPLEVWAAIDPSAHFRAVSILTTEDLVDGYDETTAEAQDSCLWKSACWLEADPVGLPRYRVEWIVIEDFA